MDLGYCKLKRANCNVLYSALHSTHGIAWTDGRVVYLAPISISHQEVEHVQPLKLGEFGHVESVHWSQDFPAGTGNSVSCQYFCYLCVLHTDSVSLWKVSGHSPNLSFKQVRKIHIQSIAKGCLWNPNRDILCLLSKDKASFYFNHTQNKGSYSLPSIESGQVNCGCWSGDGRKLVLGIGSVILIYQWQDIDESITDYTIVAWKIPGVTGQLNTIVSYGEDRILCTAELPLDQICSTQEQFFHIPDLSLFEGGRRPGNGSSSGSGSSIQSSGSDTLAQSTPSHISSLLNLQRNAQGVKQDCSQLILFGLQGKTLEPHKITSHNIQGVLSPDLLYCESDTGTVVVGSNTHTILAVFSLQEDSIIPGLMLQLNGDERPKGLCGAIKTGQKGSDGVLVAVATVDRNDNAFLPVSIYTNYKLSLRYFSLPGQTARTFVQNPKDIPNTKMFREIQLPNGNSKVHLLRIGPLKNHSNINENTKHLKIFPDKLENNLNSDVRSNISSSSDSSSTNSSTRPGSPLCNLVLPGLNELVLSNEKIFRTKVVPLSSEDTDETELEVETHSFEDEPSNFKNMKLVQMFQRPAVPSKVPCQEQPAYCDTADAHFIAGNGDVFMTRSAPAPSGRSADHVASCFPVMAEECHGSNTAQFFSPPTQEVFSNHFDIDGKDVKRENPRKCSVSVNENSLNSPRNRTDNGLQLQHLEDRMTLQEGALSLVQSKVCAMENCDVCSATCREYGTIDSVEMIYLSFQQSKENDDRGEKHAFLLDQCRLQLNVVKEFFNLRTLEMLLGGVWCVVGCNSQGYIPLSFTPGSSCLITGTSVM